MFNLNSILNYMLLLIKGFQINNNSDKLLKTFRNNQIKINNLTNNNMIIN